MCYFLYHFGDYLCLLGLEKKFICYIFLCAVCSVSYILSKNKSNNKFRFNLLILHYISHTNVYIFVYKVYTNEYLNLEFRKMVHTNIARAKKMENDLIQQIKTDKYLGKKTYSDKNIQIYFATLVYNEQMKIIASARLAKSLDPIIINFT